MQTLTALAPRWGTLLSAILIAAAFPPWDIAPLVWIALVPWLWHLKRSRTCAHSVLQGFWLSFGVGILAAPWVAYAIREFLGLSWPLSIFALAFFAATCAQPHFVFFAPLFRWIHGKAGGPSPVRRSAFTSAGLALCYSGLDWLVPRLFDVGPGYALHDSANLRQLADVGGVALLTFLVVLVNLLVHRTIDAYRAQPRNHNAVLVHAACIALLVGTAYAYGAVRNRSVGALIEAPDRVLRVGVAQGNVPNDVRLAWARGDDRAAERQLSAYMLLTEEFIEQTPGPDLVVWPEATFPGIFRKPASRLQEGRGIKFDRQVMRLNVPIVFGAYDMEEEDGQRTLFNSLFSITPNYDKPGHPGFVQTYRKHELLPFAETIPGASKGEWLHRLLPSVGFFGRGPGAGLFRILSADGQSVLLGPIICSESLHAEHVVDGARKGSQVILNVGSDGWFGRSGEPEFHLAISRFRSIETRQSQIRAANTGISALILPDGRIAARSDLGEKRILNLEVPVVRAPDTLMKRWGDWFGRIAFVLALGFVLFQWLKKGSAD